jgi:hypothetical protein
MYSLAPNIRKNIKQLLKELSLEFERDNLEEQIGNRIPFYRLLAVRNGQSVFLKAPLAQNPSSSREFINEINFHLALMRNSNHPLNRYVPEIIAYSLAPFFPYLLRISAKGNHRKSEDDFSEAEILEISRALKSIRTSPTGFFSFTPKLKLFSAARLSKKIQGSEILVGNRLKIRLDAFAVRARKNFSRFEPALSHGDFSEANTIFEPGGGVKIIDWSKVNLRNPLYDHAEFWIKRRRRAVEQDVLLKKTKADFSSNDFEFLFPAALIEIVLRDLKLFSDMIKKYRLKKRVERQAHAETERQEYLSVLNDFI